MSCSGCLLNLALGEEVIKCTSKGCKQTFHSACTNSSRLTQDEVNIWICPDCSAKARKGGDNSGTPVRNCTENVTMRKKVIHLQQKPGSHKSNAATAAAASNAATAAAASKAATTAAAASNAATTAAASKAATAAAASNTAAAAAGIDGGLQSLSSEMNLLRKSATDVWDSFRTRLDELCEKISSLDGRIKSLEKIEDENIMLKAKVAELQGQLDNHTQASLRNELEILGLEELTNENPYHLVLTTAVKLGVDLADTDLVHVSRVGPKRRGASDGVEAPPRHLPRPLAVAFVRRTKLDEFVKHAKARRNIKSKDIVESSGHDSAIYVNERLTNTNRRLFRNSRVFAREHGYRHCWVRNGTIFVRKQDAMYGSPAIRIKSDQDLLRLSNSLVQCEPSA
jgi:ribosomal protein L37AE/L43A